MNNRVKFGLTKILTGGFPQVLEKKNQVDSKSQDTNNSNNGSNSDTCSNESINDSWSLIDMSENSLKCEGNSEMDHKIQYNNNNSEVLKCEQLEKTTSDKKRNSREYIEFEPLNEDQAKKKLSPALIYLCTATYSLLPLASVLAALTLITILFTRFYFITLLYFTYVFLDRNTCNRGGRRLSFIHKSSYWTYLAAYFPIKLRRSTEFKLNEKKNYILNYHPHGIAAFGSVTAFATNGLNLKNLFPGINARFMVHETSFVTPIMREVFSWRGDCSVNSKSIDYLLSKMGSGNLLAIVVGGLAEADLSDSETLKVVVANRKGFVKKALIHGADLIPCIAFGENSVFTKVNLPESSLLHRLESKWYEMFKFKHPIYYGRSLISEDLRGIMPYKRPITVVMGDPICVERNENPTQQDIDQLHQTYLEQLKEVYESNRDLCERYDKKLEIV